MNKVNMSSEAITRRLRQASDLRELCLTLIKAKPITNERAAKLRKKRIKERKGNEDK